MFLPTTIRRSVGTFARPIGSAFSFSKVNPLRDCHLRTHQLLRGHITIFARAYFLRLNMVSHVAVGRTTCHAWPKSARASIALLSEPQWGLPLTEPPRPYSLDYSRRSRSDGRKLSTPSTSRTRRKTWSTINKLTGKSRRSSRLCPVSANSIASQLVENGAHKTGGRESTRLINKQLSDLRKNQTPEGHSISEPFRPEEFAAALRRLKPGTSRGLDFIFREFILHTLSALKFWFCDFLNSCMRQLKIPKIWRRALVVAIPKPEKSLGDPKSYRPISLLCVPFKFLERLIYLVSKQSPTHCSHMSRLVPTLEVGRRPGQSVDTGHRG